MEHTLTLITLAHQGDKAARDTLIEENIGLVWSIVRRFQNRGVETEDLFQIGSIGLIKAVDKFDPSYEVQFSTYAVPMIAGEIRRFLRDDGMLKVSRSLKELAGRIYSTKDALEKKNGREPTLFEVADELGVSQEDLVLAMEAQTQVESLQQVIYQGEGSDISLMDKLEEEENQSEQVVDRLLLEEVLKSLEGRERQLIYMRYFQEKTQAVIARQLGISQVQVSRLEKKILGKLRKKIT
ncbi:MAG TPA: RNA polymerase sporulation sigma factor SigF [Candidatus Pullilachnospira intestinigallinarum]|nr:RNA polymerase sporulation sigma factor SigF [Candidatus Pullilachnospira intestinigallinarum]